jgi:hypothetical protein
MALLFDQPSERRENRTEPRETENGIDHQHNNIETEQKETTRQDRTGQDMDMKMKGNKERYSMIDRQKGIKNLRNSRQNSSQMKMKSNSK